MNKCYTQGSRIPCSYTISSISELRVGKPGLQSNPACLLIVIAVLLLRQESVVEINSMWQTKTKRLPLWLFTENVCQLPIDVFTAHISKQSQSRRGGSVDEHLSMNQEVTV